MKKFGNIVPLKQIHTMPLTFYKKELQKTNQTDFRVEKGTKKKVKSFDSSYNSWIDKGSDGIKSGIIQNQIVIVKPKRKLEEDLYHLAEQFDIEKRNRH